MLQKFEDNHLWHSGFSWDTVLNNWPYFWAEWMPKFSFCSVGTEFIPSHLSSELAIVALHSLSYLCRINLGSFWSLSPLGWGRWEGSSMWLSGPTFTSLCVCFAFHFLPRPVHVVRWASLQLGLASVPKHLLSNHRRLGTLLMLEWLAWRRSMVYSESDGGRTQALPSDFGF